MMKHTFPFSMPCMCRKVVCVALCAYAWHAGLSVSIRIPMPGGSFDVGGALSKPYAWGQKLVLLSSFFSDEKSHWFSFSAVLDTWHMDINPLQHPLWCCGRIYALCTRARYIYVWPKNGCLYLAGHKCSQKPVYNLLLRFICWERCHLSINLLSSLGPLVHFATILLRHVLTDW